MGAPIIHERGRKTSATFVRGWAALHLRYFDNTGLMTSRVEWQ